VLTLHIEQGKSLRRPLHVCLLSLILSLLAQLSPYQFILSRANSGPLALEVLPKMWPHDQPTGRSRSGHRSCSDHGWSSPVLSRLVPDPHRSDMGLNLVGSIEWRGHHNPAIEMEDLI
jgi:hypothetical protein